MHTRRIDLWRSRYWIFRVGFRIVLFWERAPYFYGLFIFFLIYFMYSRVASRNVNWFGILNCCCSLWLWFLWWIFTQHRNRGSNATGWRRAEDSRSIAITACFYIGRHEAPTRSAGSEIRARSPRRQDDRTTDVGARRTRKAKEGAEATRRVMNENVRVRHVARMMEIAPESDEAGQTASFRSAILTNKSPGCANALGNWRIVASGWPEAPWFRSGDGDLPQIRCFSNMLREAATPSTL